MQFVSFVFLTEFEIVIYHIFYLKVYKNVNCKKVAARYSLFSHIVSRQYHLFLTH